MIKHCMTKYVVDGLIVFESWLQINFFRWSFYFSRKRYVSKIGEHAFTYSEGNKWEA